MGLSWTSPISTAHCPLITASRPSVRKDPQLAYIVEDDEDEEGHKHDECGLVNLLLHVEVDFVAQYALDEEKQNHSTVEDREREQIQNAEVEADLAGKRELGHPALHLRGLAGHLRDADGAGKLGDGNLVNEDALQHFNNQERVGAAELSGLGNRLPKGQRVVAHGRE